MIRVLLKMEEKTIRLRFYLMLELEAKLELGLELEPGTQLLKNTSLLQAVQVIGQVTVMMMEKGSHYSWVPVVEQAPVQGMQTLKEHHRLGK